MSFKKHFKEKSPVRHNLPQYGFKGSNSRISGLAVSKNNDPTLIAPVDEKGNGIPANSKIARENYRELMNKLFENNYVASSGGKPNDEELLIDKGDSNAKIALPVAKPSQQTEKEKELEVLKGFL